MPQRTTRSRARPVVQTDPAVGPTSPVYQEYDQGSQRPPNKPGQYDRRAREDDTDTLGGQGGQGPGQGRGANAGEVHRPRDRSRGR
jgi:hypothetical protein